MSEAFSQPEVRPASQAGRFYEADPARLRATVERLLAEAPAAGPPEGSRPLAVVAPHAGYIYSGPVAAAAFRRLAGLAIDRVLVLAPSHHVDFTGAALPAAVAFATPLGRVPIDRAAVASLAARPGFTINEEVHGPEHSIEVELPFLQVALTRPFELLPLALGRPPRGTGLEPLAGPLLELLQARAATGQAWIIVASTDTYHGYDAEACAVNDRHLGMLIEQMDAGLLLEAAREREVMACGWVGLALAAELARRLGARRGSILGRADSRAGTGPVGDYVVGYIAAAFE